MVPSVVLRAALATLALLSALVTPASAQRARLVGRGDIELDRRIRRFLEVGDYRLIARDTLLASGDTLAGPVLAAAATIRVEGVIRGDLLIVDANVFLRPSARVLGNVTNLGGGYYRSEQATVSGDVDNQPNAPYDAVRDGADIRIVGMQRRSLLTLEGVRGLRIPSYDRVDGLTAGVGAGYFLPQLAAVEPVLRGRVAYHSQRGAWSGGGELGLIGGPITLRGGMERATLTNEEWIRRTPVNSLSFLTRGKDYRNYYQADLRYISLEGVFDATTTIFRPSVRAQLEDAVSLRAGDPWTVLSADSVRTNPAIDRGRISSLITALTVELERSSFQTTLGGRVEVASEALKGDFEFNRFELFGEWAMKALADHTLAVEWTFRGPLPGTDSLPHQRWTFVGGSGTLYTFQTGQFPGDRVAFVETEYLIPLPDRMRVPILGTPSFDLLHHVGMAWAHGHDRDFEQNVGLRLRFPLVYVRAITNPRTRFDDLEIGIGVNLPRTYPWVRRGEEGTR